MAEEQNRSRLGRGLAALIGDVGEPTAATPDRARGQKKVPTEFLRPNPRNPRRTFVEDDLEDLVNSIREKGIIQPILVRMMAGVDDVYEIIAGERRWRAAQRASLHEVPIVVIEAGDKEALEIAIIENVQRADLNAIEEAMAYVQECMRWTPDWAKGLLGVRPLRTSSTNRLMPLLNRAVSKCKLTSAS